MLLNAEMMVKRPRLMQRLTGMTKEEFSEIHKAFAEA
jgi:hypothetical protein